MYYAADRQINFLVPSSAIGDLDLVVINSLGSSTPVKVNVQPLMPGIFFDASNRAAVLVAGTGKLTYDRAAAAGDGLEIYCTGLGQTRIGSITGTQQTVVTPQVFIGGKEAGVLFSGLAPGIPGVYQVNASVPSGVSGEVTVRIVIDGVSSNEAGVLLR
jgi:uncharacterized protein (TIGR03437 family)